VMALEMTQIAVRCSRALRLQTCVVPLWMLKHSATVVIILISVVLLGF